MKAPKRGGTLRRGAAFVIRRADGALLVRTRPPKGLLGGMTEIPGTDWTAEGPGRDPAPPVRLAFRRLPGTVGHVFTHFPLELTVFDAVAPQGLAAPEGHRWITAAEIEGEAFPTVFRKVIAHAFAT